MKDRRGSGGGNGGRPMSGRTAVGLDLSHSICGSLSDKSSTSTRNGLLAGLSA
jgi:hypothetical protein